MQMQGYLSRIHFHFRFRCSSVSRPLTWSTPQLLTLAKIATFWCLARNANSNSGVWSSQVGPAKLPLCHRLTDAACVLYPVSLYPGSMYPCVCVCVRVHGCLRCRLLWGRGEAQALVKVNFTLCQAALYSFFPRVSVLLPTDNVFFFFEHYI